MRKNLTILLMSMALFLLPSTVHAQIQCDGSESCSITIEGADSYGDGWDNAAIHIYQDTILRGTFTVESSTNTATFQVCPDSIRFYFVEAGYHFANEVSFTIYAADGSVIADYSTSSGLAGGTPFLSTIVECPSCIAPALLTLNSVTSSSATIAWLLSDNATESYYQITTGNVNEHNWTLVNADSITVNGLDANTTYTLYIYSVCGAGDTSITTSLQFRTLCGTTTLPFIEGFESTTGNLPNCWTAYESYSTYFESYPNVSSYDSYAHSGSHALVLSNEEDCSIISPIIPIPGNEIDLCFWAMIENPDGGELQIGYVTEPDTSSDFHLATTVELTDSYQYYNVLFDNISETDTVYVVFRTEQTTTMYGYANHYIDDLTIRQARSCYTPQNFRIASVESTAVTFTWSDSTNSPEYQIAYGTTGFDIDLIDEDSIMTSQDTTITIENLNNVLYDFYIRSNCTEEPSYWVGPISAQPGVYTMPATGMDTIYTCNNLITDDGGISGNYSRAANGTLVVYPATTDSMVRVSGIAYISDYSDQLRIYDGAGTNGTLLYQGQGDSVVIDTLTATTGPITICFSSDEYSNEDRGFELQVSCVEAPTCKYPHNSRATNVAVNSAQVQWDVVGSDEWDIPTSFSVEVTETETSTTVTYTVSDSYIFLTDLTPGTHYMVHIRGNCSDITDSVSLYTHSLPCATFDANNSITVAINDTTDNLESQNLPVNYYYNYSISQQIYLASELDSVDVITALEFHTQGINDTTREWEIYLANVPNTTVSEWIYPNNLQLVYDGPITSPAYSWVRFTLTEPFSYDPTQNLLVMIYDKSGDYSVDNYFSVHSIEHSSRYVTNDASPYNVSNIAGGSNCSERNNIRFVSSNCTSLETCLAPNVNIVSLENDAIGLEWTPGYLETSWQIAYLADGDSTWTIDESSTSLTDHIIYNLQPNTQYSIRVTAQCDTDSASAVLSAKTPCSGINTFPFIESFDTNFTAPSEVGSSVEACWGRISNQNYYIYPNVTEEVSHSGESSLTFSSGSSTYNFIVLPPMDEDITTLELQFMNYCYEYSLSSQIVVGVLTDPNDLNTMTTITTLSPTNAEEWEAFRVLFTDYIGTGKSIAIGSQYTSSSFYIDNISIDYIQSCTTPTNITADSITTSTALISWTDTLSSSFEVEYGLADFGHGNGTRIVANANSIMLTGLQHSSTYDVYVRSLCSNGDTSGWSLARRFETECGNIDQLPYTEDFTQYEGYTTPRCWNIEGSAFVTTSNDYVNKLFSIESSTFTGLGTVHLPSIDSSIDINDIQISFSACDMWSSGSSLVVGISDVASSNYTMTALDTIVLTSEMVFHEINLSNYSGNNRIITFQNASTGDMFSTCEIDNVVVEAIPTCERVYDMTASNNTATTVELSWTDPNQSSSWLVEYGPMGFTTGQGTTVTVTTLPHTLTGLTNNTNYEYNVRPICSATDTGSWAYQRKAFSTTQIPATIPYSYDFETVTEWNNWSTNSNNGVNWFRGTADAQSGTSSAYVSNDNGITIGTDQYNITNAVLYRDIDFGTSDSTYILSFNARSGGNSTDATNAGLVVLLVDPSIPVQASNNSATSPWGNIDSLYQYIRIGYTDTAWSSYNVSIDNVSGIQRLVFFWYNSFMFNFVGTPGVVDDISIQYSACPRPTGLTASNITSSSATLSWNGDANAQYEIVYNQGSNSTNQTVTSNTNSIALSNLTPGTSYYAQVRKICGNDTSIYSDAYTFTTLCNENAIDEYPFVERFESPLNCWQQEFVSNTFEWTIATGNNNHSVTTQAFQGNSNALFAPSTSGSIITKLISPVMDITVLDSAFLAFAHTQESWYGDIDTLAVYYRTSATADWTYLESWSGDIATWQIDTLYLPNPSSTYQFAFEGHNNYGYGVAIDSVVVFGSAPSCHTPVITLENVDYGSIEISWIGSGTAYEVAIKENTTSQWPQSTLINTNTHTFNNLSAGTTYHIRVRRDCTADSLGYSDWSTITVTTDSLPCFAPIDLEISNIGYGTATIDWTAGDDETEWIVNVFRSDVNIFDTVTSHPYTIEGLFAGMAYNIAVQSVCGNGASYSDWSDTLSFTTNICEPVSEVSIEVTDNTNATVSWTSAEGTDSWQINYGELDFVADQGTLIEVSTNPYTIENLASGYYDLYIRTICEENVFSVWSPVAQFEITGVGIDEADNMNISIYPNPTNGNTTISVSGAQGMVKIDIVDINGRVVMSETITCNSECVKKMNVDTLAQGAYFVRIAGEEVNMVKKLIVR